MVIGGALGQGMIVLVSPLLTRLYTPADFGVFAVFTALVLMLSVVATLRLETAVVLPERDEEAAALAWSALSAAVVIAGLVGLVGLLAVAPLARWLGTPG